MAAKPLRMMRRQMRIESLTLEQIQRLCKNHIDLSLFFFFCFFSLFFSREKKKKRR